MFHKGGILAPHVNFVVSQCSIDPRFDQISNIKSKIWKQQQYSVANKKRSMLKRKCSHLPQMSIENLSSTKFFFFWHGIFFMLRIDWKTVIFQYNFFYQFCHHLDTVHNLNCMFHAYVQWNSIRTNFKRFSRQPFDHSNFNCFFFFE